MKGESNVTIENGTIKFSTEKAEITHDKDKISASAPLIIIQESDK